MSVTSQPKTQAKKNYALPIAIMFALFFMIAFVTGYQNPLGSVIKKMSGGDPIMTQLGTLANFIAYAFMGLPAGKLLEKKGYRVTALTAVTVGFVGVLITYISGLFDPETETTTALIVYILGAFIAGFSMCMLNTVVNPMLNSLGSTPNKGNQLVQFGGSCNSLGATLAPVVVGGLIGGSASTIASANPVFYLAMGIFAAAFIVLYFSKLPENPDLGKKSENLPISGALRHSNLLFGLVAIFCYVGIEVGIANFTLQYIENNDQVATLNPGISAGASAGTVVGIYWLLMLVGRLIGGAIGGKVSSRSMLVFTAIGVLVLLIAGIVSTETMASFFGFDSAQLSFGTVTIPLNAIFFTLCGIFTSVMWGAIFNLSVTGLGKYTAVASGLFMVMVCGGGIFPAIQGVLAKGSILSSFWLPVVLAAYLLIYALFLSRTGKADEAK
jgi:FHS family L-fucose permease-like MFS transporter